MNSLEDMQNKIRDLKRLKEYYLDNIAITHKIVEEIDQDLFSAKIRSLYINEIYRQAAYHFPRLRREPDKGLLELDIVELEKWISRAKNDESLKDILGALIELRKYRPIDIVKNVYALVQKIIIEGPYNGKIQ